MVQSRSAGCPLKVAIVGSGPSGFYAAEALFRSGRDIEVDVFDRLAVPFGLVRSGVAPDHPRLKQAIKVFERIATTPGFGFFGNVTVGRDIPVAALRLHYHAVIVACGAESNRRIGIPGEELRGIHSAREFVGWYNGHPDFRGLQVDLSHPMAVIFGQGNVALDVARILGKTRDELKNTDIAAHALDALAESRIREIHVIGRRGPAQAKFTAKELREFSALRDCRPVVDPTALALNRASEIEIADRNNADGKRVFDLLSDFSRRPGISHERRYVHFTFLMSPIAFFGRDRVEKVRLETTSLEGEPFRQSARGTGWTVDWETGMVFSSIGYKGTAMAGLPFDRARGVIPNRDGRVWERGRTIPGVYVTGWIKRGPTGIIGTNRADSVGTVQALLEDFGVPGSSSDKPGRRGLVRLLDARGIRFISFAGWQRIDRGEIERGLARQKPREKYTSVEEMLAVVD